MAEPKPEGMTFTWDMFQEFVKQNREAMVEFARELKRLPPDEQEALDKRKQRERENRVSRVKEAMQNERVKKVTQFHCSHIKHAEGVYKQEHAFRGQVNNDNCCRAICIRCSKLFPAFKVTQENLKSGMGLQNIKNLTPEILYQAHMKSFPDCPECKKGLCAVGDLRQLKQGHLDPLPEVLPDGKVRVETLTA